MFPNIDLKDETSYTLYKIRGLDSLEESSTVSLSAINSGVKSDNVIDEFTPFVITETQTYQDFYFYDASLFNYPFIMGRYPSSNNPTYETTIITDMSTLPNKDTLDTILSKDSKTITKAFSLTFDSNLSIQLDYYNVNKQDSTYQLYIHKNNSYVPLKADQLTYNLDDDNNITTTRIYHSRPIETTSAYIVVTEPLEGEDSILFNGDLYKEVTSPFTGKVWLDRNLGASEVCTHARGNFGSDSDYIESQQNCFGDYYQWGRSADGHEKLTSTTTTSIATTLIPGHNQFIIDENDQDTISDWTTADAGGTLRAQEWSKTDGSSICPVGFRVPTKS